ncbi:hypothetical protein LIER_18823 [Lithospermum erythrorhizon]|uniref:Uncharacterized protein n=1 Tax=Lithospermum erythrorhizon TaxID=34254 RepID=A0AAV3QI07_LITER
MADEVLAHLADGQAFNISFLPALRHGMECYFEKVGSALQVVSEAGYRRDFLLPVLEEALHLAEIVLQLALDEASFGALRSASSPAADVEGEDTAADTLLEGLESVQGALEDMVPEHLP